MPVYVNVLGYINFNMDVMLDYGCGRGNLTDFFKNKLGVKTYKYDPAISEYSNLEVQSVDLVTSSDVLEHVPYQDLNWVINEIFEYSKKIVFINVACYPASARLPNGKNAHVSVFDPWWWCGFIHSIASNYERKVFVTCTYPKEGKKKFFNYAINDSFNNYK